MGVQPISASLMRQARDATGLSQRSFAALARTSGPTVAAYESGTKEPRLSTLERIASAVGLEIEIRLTPGGPGSVLRERREHGSLALAAATAAAVQRDFGRAQRLAEENLVLAEKLVGATSARRWLDEWRRVIESGPEAVRCAFLEEGEHGHDMRQMSPFSGVLPDEVRRAVLDATDGWRDRLVALRCDTPRPYSPGHPALRGRAIAVREGARRRRSPRHGRRRSSGGAPSTASRRGRRPRRGDGV